MVSDGRLTGFLERSPSPDARASMLIGSCAQSTNGGANVLRPAITLRTTVFVNDTGAKRFWQLIFAFKEASDGEVVD